MNNSVFTLQYGSDKGPFLTQSLPVLVDFEGVEWVYFNDPSQLSELVADGWNLTTAPWEMADDQDNAATLESMKAQTGDRIRKDSLKTSLSENRTYTTRHGTEATMNTGDRIGECTDE